MKITQLIPVTLFVALLTVTPTDAAWRTLLLPADRFAGDHYGNALAMGTDTVLAASIFDDDGAATTGSAYLWSTSDNGATWTMTHKFTASDAQRLDQFGQSVAITPDSQTVVVGAAMADPGGLSSAGKVYVYKSANGGSTWVESVLTASSGTANDQLGWSVAVSADGNTVVAGANQAPDYSRAGRVFVYRTTNGGTSWTEKQTLVASDDDPSSENRREFGTSVGVSNDGLTIAASSYWAGTQGLPGVVYIFKSTDGGESYTETRRLLKSDGTNFERFGQEISLSGDGNTVVATSQNQDLGNNHQGAVYVFSTSDNGATWSETKLTAPEHARASGVSFGADVALSNDASTLLVGNGVRGFHLFAKQGSAWSEISRSMDREAFQVALSPTGSRAGWANKFASESGITSGSVSTTSCERGFVDLATESCVQSCPSGRHCSNGWARWCPAGKSSPPGAAAASDCTACAAGSYSLDGSPCTSCPIGAYCPASATEPALCPENTANHLPGQSAASACTPCAGGTVSPPGASTCTARAATAEVTATDGGRSGNNFGGAMDFSADGTQLAIGASSDRPHGTNSGSLYLYNTTDAGLTWAGDKYVLEAGASGDQFGRSVAFAAGGTAVAVGAPGRSTGGTVVLFYSQDGGATWTADADELTAKDQYIHSGDEFGYALDASSDGTRLVVGAWKDDIEGGDSGIAFNFRTADSGATWTKEEMIASDGFTGDKFGCSAAISLDGSRIALGTILAEAVYVFDASNGGAIWNETTILTPTPFVNNMEFGIDVDINADGTRIVVGEKGSDTVAGAVYIFETADAGTTWSQTARLQPLDSVAWDSFGISVSMSSSGDVIAVMSKTRFPKRSGLYLFSTLDDGSTWHEMKIWTADPQFDGGPFGPTDVTFGRSVALSQDARKVAIAEDSGSGKVYVMTCTTNQFMAVVEAKLGSFCVTADKCPPGWYCPASSPVAIACPVGTWSAAVGATDSSTCQACPAGTITDKYGSTSADACAKCPRGFYTTNGIDCTNCAAGSSTSADGSAAGPGDCLSCPIGTYATAGSECTVCPDRKITAATGAVSEGQCIACSSCGQCGPGQRPNGGECEDCPIGTYSQDGAACVACSAGSTTNAPGSWHPLQCVLCPIGSYSTGDGQCIECSGTETTAAAGATSADQCEECSSCAQCDPGTGPSQADPSVCEACPVGTYSTAGSCEACPALSTTATTGSTSADQCVCSAGARPDGSNPDECEACPRGRFSTDGTECNACYAGSSTSGTGATSLSDCVECELGTYASAGSECTACPAGSTTSSTGSASAGDCVTCPMGRWSAGGGACTACAAGTSTSTTGSTSAGDCDDCAQGSYSAGGAACSECPANQNTTSTGSTSVADCMCEPGSYASGSDCLQCAGGTYSNTFDATECTNCSADTYALAGSDSCTSCPTLFNSLPGSTSCSLDRDEHLFLLDCSTLLDYMGNSVINHGVRSENGACVFENNAYLEVVWNSDLSKMSSGAFIYADYDADENPNTGSPLMPIVGGPSAQWSLAHTTSGFVSTIGASQCNATVAGWTAFGSRHGVSARATGASTVLKSSGVTRETCAASLGSDMTYLLIGRTDETGSPLYFDGTMYALYIGASERTATAINDILAASMATCPLGYGWDSSTSQCAQCEAGTYSSTASRDECQTCATANTAGASACSSGSTGAGSSSSSSSAGLYAGVGVAVAVVLGIAVVVVNRIKPWNTNTGGTAPTSSSSTSLPMGNVQTSNSLHQMSTKT